MSDTQTTLSPEGLGKLDKESAEGQDEAIEKALSDAKKDVYEYDGKTYTAHPVATLFPLITGDQFNELVVSLKHNGMRHPVLLLGDQIVDGRNRFRAAKKAGVKIVFQQIDPNEDVCVIAMDMNIHRRDLKGRRVALASMLRRMSLRLQQLRRDETARADREAKEKERAAAPAEGGDRGAAAAGSSGAASPPFVGGTAAGDASGADAASGAGVGAAAVEAVEGSTPSVLDKSSALASRENAAKAAGVSRSSLERFDKVVAKAPDLEEEITEGRLSVRDAEVVSQEDPELRRQVVDDVREGRARTGAQAIEKRTGRAPKARTRPKASRGAKRDDGGGGVAGMPPLPAVGGAAGGTDAGASGTAAVAASQPSRPSLSAQALSPSLLLAGVRKVMPAIKLDPCSSQVGNERVRALRYFNREEDGCQKAWEGDVYAFPPPQFAGRFASKLMGEMLAGRVPRALFLAPSDLADQDQGLLLRNSQLSGVVYELERSDFDIEGGKSAKAPSRMMLYVFGIDRKLLYDAFDPWGKVLTVSSGR